MIKRTPLTVLTVAIVLLASAAVMPEARSSHQFGNQFGKGPGGLGPLDQVFASAGEHDAPECGLSQDKLAALALSITWPEAVGERTDVIPHPMTLSRGDWYENEDGTHNQGGRNIRLYYDSDVNNHERVFWHPGLGMWQMDDIGLGSNLASGRFRPYDTVAGTLKVRYCKDPNLATLYQGWKHCNRGECAAIFADIYDPANDEVVHLNQLDDTVDYFGGIEQRRCRIRSQRFDCLYVNETAADPQGYSEWKSGANDGGPGGRSPSPLSAPFYIYAVPDGDTLREQRVWLTDDTDHDFDVQASRPYGHDSRRSLSWEPNSSLCDMTSGQGDC